MTADFGLVVNAAQTDALELASERARNALADARFSDARRTVQAQYGRFEVVAQGENREVFDDPIFDVFQTVVVGVEDFASMIEVELIFAIFRERATAYSALDCGK